MQAFSIKQIEHLSEITIADSQYDTAMNILKYVHQYFTYDFVYTGAPEYYAVSYTHLTLPTILLV